MHSMLIVYLNKLVFVLEERHIRDDQACLLALSSAVIGIIPQQLRKFLLYKQETISFARY